MTYINPISDPKDILEEANQNQPIRAAEPQPTPGAEEILPVFKEETAEPQPEAKPQPVVAEQTSAEAASLAQLDAETPPVAPDSNPTVVDKPPVTFVHRLPLLSYILAALYIQFFILQSILVITTLVAGGGRVFTLASGEVNGLAILAVFGLLATALLIGKAFTRYVALIIALGGLGYIGYQIFAIISASAGAPSYYGSFWGYAIVSYLPYIAVFALTIIHLLRSKVARAYN